VVLSSKPTDDLSAFFYLAGKMAPVCLLGERILI